MQSRPYIHTKVHTGKYLCSCKVQPLNDDWVSFPIISHRPQPLKLNFLSSLKWMWNCIFPPLPSYVSSPSPPLLSYPTPHCCVLFTFVLSGKLFCTFFAYRIHGIILVKVYFILKQSSDNFSSKMTNVKYEIQTKR